MGGFGFGEDGGDDERCGRRLSLRGSVVPSVEIAVGQLLLQMSLGDEGIAAGMRSAGWGDAELLLLDMAGRWLHHETAHGRCVRLRHETGRVVGLLKGECRRRWAGERDGRLVEGLRLDDRLSLGVSGGCG